MELHKYFSLDIQRRHEDMLADDFSEEKTTENWTMPLNITEVTYGVCVCVNHDWISQNF